jgi:hypothetical protein
MGNIVEYPDRATRRDRPYEKYNFNISVSDFSAESMPANS